MDQAKILALTHCIAAEVRNYFVHVCVYEVQKCNFNDQFLICEKWLPLCDLDGAPLTFFDAFLGKNADGVQEVAVAYVDRESFWVHNKTQNGIEARECDTYCDHIYAAPSDATTFLASHISITTKKW